MYLYILDGHLTRSVPNRFSHYANPGSASHTLASFSVVPCPACISVDEQTVSIPLSHLPSLSHRPSLSLFFKYIHTAISTIHVFFSTSLQWPCTMRTCRFQADVIAISTYSLTIVERYNAYKSADCRSSLALLQMGHVVSQNHQLSDDR